MAYKCDLCGVAEDKENGIGLHCMWGPHYDWQLCPKCDAIFKKLKVMNVIKAYKKDLEEVDKFREMMKNRLIFGED